MENCKQSRLWTAMSTHRFFFAGASGTNTFPTKLNVV